MPFDLNNYSEVKDLKADIDKLAAQDDCRQRMREFFWWRISASGSSGEYRLSTPEDAGDEEDAEDEGYYLANLVLQGGGTLGLAHAGLIVGLERANVRFSAIAGTSAGSIVAAGMIALRGDDILGKVSREVCELVCDVPMDTFVDGPRPVRRVIKQFVKGRSMLRPLLWPGLWAALAQFRRRRGLNGGYIFEDWMQREVFDANGLHKIGDLGARLDRIAQKLADAEYHGKAEHPFQSRKYGQVGDPVTGSDLFKIISTAMPTGTKFSLPQDLEYLAEEYGTLSPAMLVRMSMSVPVFFEPYVMRIDREKWRSKVADDIAPFVSDAEVETTQELRELTFLDGGLFSNLPTDELVNAMPDIPTISVPLVSTDRRVDITNRRSFRAIGNDAAALLNSVRLQRDRDAHARQFKERERWCAAQQPKQGGAPCSKRKFPQIVAKIDTGRANWLNFIMTDDEKVQLFVAGLKRARNLLKEGF